MKKGLDLEKESAETPLLPLEQAVSATISRYNMLAFSGPLGVAVSGGADSVALLRLLLRLGHDNLVVLHVQHALRGTDSADDEQFVRQLASQLGLPFLCQTIPPPPVTGNLEQYLRLARLRAFADWVASGAIQRVATGHNASDQAETVLARLVRGTGNSGLAGILPVTREGLVRPLLGCSRHQLRTWLTQLGQPWREDATNLDPRFTRNRIRHHLLPALASQYNPQIESALGRLADLSHQEEEYWRMQVQNFFAENLIAPAFFAASNAATLPVAALRQLHPALLRRVLRHAIQLRLGHLRRIETSHIDGLAALLAPNHPGVSVTLPGLTVTLNSGQLIFTLAPKEAPPPDLLCDLQQPDPPIAGEKYWGDYHFSWSWAQADAPAPHLSDEEQANESKISGYTVVERVEVGFSHPPKMLHIRGWRRGDKFWLAGRPAPEPLKILLRRVAGISWDSSQWPIISEGDYPIWVYPLGVDHRHLTSHSASQRLRIQVSLATQSGESREL